MFKIVSKIVLRKKQYNILSKKKKCKKAVDFLLKKRLRKILSKNFLKKEITFISYRVWPVSCFLL